MKGRSDPRMQDAFAPTTEAPSLWWRSTSYGTILAVSALSRAFLYLFNKTEVNGLPRFLDLLKSRSDHTNRRRGLITVSNHISVLDDPVIWGVLPLSFAAYHGYMNHRWTLGSHDICFKSPIRSHFFTLGQTLPTHRLAHSPFGGPEQVTMTEAIRILSKISINKSWLCPYNDPLYDGMSHSPSWPRDCVDPFSDISPAPAYPSRIRDERYYFQPSRYVCNSYSWVHVFPEGLTHQAEDQTMRYFKWGVARLILETPVCPDVVPLFIEGTDKVMHESRGFPRFLPRIGKKIVVNIGEAVDTEARFGDLRRRWKKLADDHAREMGQSPAFTDVAFGWNTDDFCESPEIVELRKECAKRVREEVLKVRRSRGLPDEDPKDGMVETWAKEGPKREGEMKDGSWIKDT